VHARARCRAAAVVRVLVTWPSREPSLFGRFGTFSVWSGLDDQDTSVISTVAEEPHSDCSCLEPWWRAAGWRGSLFAQRRSVRQGLFSGMS
jgi:hypothetical protein